MRKLLNRVTIVLIFIVILILSGFTGCKDDEPPPEHVRLERVLDLISVRIFDADDNLTSDSDFTLGEYRDIADVFTHQKVELYINFEEILGEAGVQYGDFDIAHRQGFEFERRLQQELDIAIHYVHNLEINIPDVDYLMCANRFHNIDTIVNLGRLPIRLHRFIRPNERIPERTIRATTSNGGFYIYSDFIWDGTLGGCDDASESGSRVIDRYNDYLTLVFEYDEDNSTINLHLWDSDDYDAIQAGAPVDQDRVPLDIQNAGRSVHIFFPLSTIDGFNDYHAVRFTYPGMTGMSDILPRSFVIDGYMHLYFNRLGTFQLITTTHGNTRNPTDFLFDRGIEFRNLYNNRYVRRGEFYINLMRIHWAEGLNLVTEWRDAPPPDLDDIKDGERIRIGHSLRVDIEGREEGATPYILDGHRDGDFRPEEPLIRSHLYMMLAGNIAYFNFEVNGLLGSYGVAEIDSSYQEYWQYRFNFLRGIGFVPYACDENGIPYVAPSGYITVDEAKDILLMLILGQHHYEAWNQ